MNIRDYRSPLLVSLPLLFLFPLLLNPWSLPPNMTKVLGISIAAFKKKEVVAAFCVSDSPLLFNLPSSLLCSYLPLSGLLLVHLPPLLLQRLSFLLGSFDLLPSANLFIPLDNHSRLTLCYHFIFHCYASFQIFFPPTKQPSVI